MTYNGWTNRETWGVNVWLYNEEGSYRAVERAAQECYAEKLSQPEIEQKFREVAQVWIPFEEWKTIGSPDAVNWSEIATYALEEQVIEIVPTYIFEVHMDGELIIESSDVQESVAAFIKLITEGKENVTFNSKKVY